MFRDESFAGHSDLEETLEPALSREGYTPPSEVIVRCLLRAFFELALSIGCQVFALFAFTKKDR